MSASTLFVYTTSMSDTLYCDFMIAMRSPDDGNFPALF